MKENAHHCLKKNADDHEWAQLFQWENLPMNLNGPIHFLQKPVDVFNGPIRMREENCPWARMGPFTSFRKLPMSLNGPIHFLQKTADNLNGPIRTHEEIFQWARMGPVCSMRETADELDWAHSHAWTKPPNDSNGPSMFNERNCRCPWMGPFPCMKKTTNDCNWAQHVQWEKLSSPWMGPACSMRETAYELEEAHFLAQRSLSMTRNGPILLHNLTHRLHWMGPFSCMKKTADVTNEPIWEKLPMRLEWTHSLTWETANELELSHSHAGTKLPMSTNGPIL